MHALHSKGNFNNSRFFWSFYKSNEAEYVNRLPEKDIVSFIPKKRGWRRKRKAVEELIDLHSRWLYLALCLEDIVPHCAGTKPKMSARCLEVEPVVKVQGSLAGGEQTSCARNLFRTWSDIALGHFDFSKKKFQSGGSRSNPVSHQACFLSSSSFM